VGRLAGIQLVSQILGKPIVACMTFNPYIDSYLECCPTSLSEGHSASGPPPSIGGRPPKPQRWFGTLAWRVGPGWLLH